MLRKNNVIKIDGNMGYAEIVVKYQGSRAMMKEVYDDVDKFNHYWKPIDGYWERDMEHHVGRYGKAMVDAFLERTKGVNLSRKYDKEEDA